MVGKVDHLERVSRRLTLFTFAVALLVVVAAPVLGISYSNRPFLGFFTDPLLVVNNMSGQGWVAHDLGIGRPERVVRVGGVAVSDQAEFQAALSGRDLGSDVSLFTEFPDGSFRLYPSVRLGEFPTRDFVRYFWLPYFIGLAYFIIGLWIYSVSGQTRPGRSLAFFCASTAIVCMLIFDYTTTQALVFFWLLAFAQVGGALLSMAMRFPLEWIAVGRRPWLLAIPYGASATMAIWSIRLIARSESPWDYGAAINGLYLYTAASVLFFLATMTYLGFRSTWPTVRRQARIVLLGSGLAFLPVTVWFMLPVLGIDIPFDSALYLPTLIVFPMAVAVAILRYRLWEIDALVNQATVYGVLTAIMAGFFTASSSVLQKLFVAFTGERSDAALVLTSFVIAATFVPVRSRVQRFVDRQFKEASDAAEPLRALGLEADNLLMLSNPRRLTYRLLEVAAKSLGAESAILTLDGDAPLSFTQVYGSWRGDATACVPLDCEGKRYGLLFLGRRATVDPYSRADFETLRQVTDRVAWLIHIHATLARP